MKTYPDYNVLEIRAKGSGGRRVGVKVGASTRCGPKIEAYSAVMADNIERDTIERAKSEALRVAVRNLAAKHTAVVNTCKKRGTHEGHG